MKNENLETAPQARSREKAFRLVAQPVGRVSDVTVRDVGQIHSLPYGPHPKIPGQRKADNEEIAVIFWTFKNPCPVPPPSQISDGKKHIQVIKFGGYRQKQPKRGHPKVTYFPTGSIPKIKVERTKR